MLRLYEKLLSAEAGLVSLVELVLDLNESDEGIDPKIEIPCAVSLSIRAHRNRAERVAPETHRSPRAGQHLVVEVWRHAVQHNVQSLARNANAAPPEGFSGKPGKRAARKETPVACALAPLV